MRSVARIPTGPVLVAAVLALSAPGNEAIPLIGASLAGAQSTESLTFRRVWKGEVANICCAAFPAPSPDGMRVPGVDWMTGDLAYLDLRTGEWVRITDKGPWQRSADFAMNAIFSPDGNRLAYSWFTFKGEESEFDLRVSELDGSNVRVLIPGSESPYSWPLDWSRDGGHILAAKTLDQHSAEAQLVSISLADGEERVLKYFESDWDWSEGYLRAAFSPDGRYVAYERPASGSPTLDVYAAATDGAAEGPLVRGNGTDRLMGWTRDGSAILFYSDRDLTRAIWRLPVRDGRPAGDPELLKADVWQLEPMGFGAAGFYYAVLTEAPQLHTAGIDLGEARVVTPPTPVRDASDGWSRSPAWSPDGRQLAFIESRSPVLGPVGGASKLVIRSVETGETRQIQLPFEGPGALTWPADGRSVTVRGAYRAERGYFRLDLQSGEVVPIARLSELPQGCGAFSPDGETLYCPTGGSRMEGRLEIRSREVRSGRETTLAEIEGGPGVISVSGDGRLLAILTFIREPSEPSLLGGTVRVLTLPASGGEPTLVYEGANPFFGLPDMAMSLDGDHIVFGGFEEGGSALYVVPTSGGEAKRIMEGDEFREFALSPDGKRIAYWKGTARGEIWVIEGI